MNAAEAALMQAFHVAILSTDESTLDQVDAAVAAVDPKTLITGLLGILNLLGGQVCGSSAAFRKLLEAWAPQMAVSIAFAQELDSLPEIPEPS